MLIISLTILFFVLLKEMEREYKAKLDKLQKELDNLKRRQL